MSVAGNTREAPDTTPEARRLVIELLNESLSAEYHSFVGHALGSNPFVAPGQEKDLELLDRIRDEENENTRALLIQLGRYRAGPTIRAFRWWKHDLNFLGLDFLVIKAAEIAKEEAARIERALARVPVMDAQLRATFESILQVKRRHAAELGKIAAQRDKERTALRAAHFAVTGIPLKKSTVTKGAAASAPAAAATGAPKAPALPGAPKLPGAPTAPKLPGALSAPKLPGAPSAPKPPGAGPSPPKPPSPPLPPK